MALNFIIPVAPQPPKPAARAPSSPGSNSTANNSANSAASRAAAGSANRNGGGGSGSSNSSSSNAAKSSAKGIGGSSRGSPANSGSTSSTQTKNASASSQSKQAASSAQAQSTGGSASSTPNASDKSDGPSFIEALAKSQAQAADSVSDVATAAPEEVTGGSKSSKTERGDDSDTSAASFGFLAQSMAAVLAGNQQQPAAQGTATDGSLDGTAVDGVSLGSGSSIENIVANLTKGTAAGLKAATAAADDSKGPATSQGAANGGASGVGATQAQMGANSHFQLNAQNPVTNDKVTAPVGSPAFNDELGGKITWMANQGVQSASVQLSPEHLGPVAVHISVQDGSASVSFNANHADTRAALEQALPRLREMFATQGLTLTDASVSHQSPRGQPQKQAVAAIGAVGGASTEESTTPIAAVASARPGLVDTYA